MQGGPTLKQVYALFENIQKSKNYELEFQAMIHGVELKGTNNHTDKTKNEDSAVPFFGDPKEYDHLSDVEREEMTKKMMGKHKNWAGKGVLK